MACDDRHSDWKDFPNGLQVLLVDEDIKTLNEYKCKLEECKYIVTPFTNGTEALQCANTSRRTFHVALVEAMIGEGLEGLRLLKEMSKFLPVVLMSNTHNMALMMQGIAMGAADFLQKPLSDEKLRNIWTHVMRKGVEKLDHLDNVHLDWAVSSGDLALMETLAPSKAKTSTVFHVSTPRDVHTKNIFQGDGGVPEVCGKRVLCEDTGDEPAAKMSRVQSSTVGSTRVSTDDELMQSELEQNRTEEASSRSDSPEQANEDLAATVLLPKMEWSDQLLCQPADIHILSDESLGDLDGDYMQEVGQGKGPQKDEQDKDKKPKLKIEPTDDQGYDSVVLDDIEDSSVELDPCSLLSVPTDVLDFPMEGLDGGEVHDHEFNAQSEAAMMSMIKGDEEEERSASAGTTTMMGNDEEASDEHGLYADEQGGKGGKSGRRKMKVDWTPELHRRFVQAVEQLGVEKAIPSRILELMGVQCLTRHNIASHLQKYRSHRRHVLAREAAEAATWQQHRRPSEGSAWPRMRRDGTPWVSSHTNPPPIQPRPAIGTPSAVQPHAVLPGPTPQPAPPHQPMMMLHVWGHPSVEPAPPMWQQPVGVPMQPMWPATDGTIWGQPRLGMPVGPLPPMSGFYLPTTPSMPFMPAMHAPVPGTSSMDEAMPLPFYHQLLDDPELAGTCGKPFEPHPPMDVLEATINEALSNPRTAQLPLGLKAPSVEGVMAELYKNSLVKV